MTARARAVLLVVLASWACGEGTAELPVVPTPLDLEHLDLELQRRHAELAAPVAAASAAAPAAAAEAYGRLGIFLLAQGALDGAGLCFETAERLAPRDGRWPSYRGHVELRRGSLPAAQEAFEARLRQAPDDAATLLWLAEIDLARGDAAAAERSLQRLPAADGESAPARVQLARVRLLQERPREALAALSGIAASGPWGGIAAHLEAEAHRKLGDLEAASRALARGTAGGSLRALLLARDPLWEAVEAEGRGARRHDQRALEAMRRGQLELALVELHQALATDPNRLYARLDIADLLVRLGREEEAAAELEALLEGAPDYPPALRRLGELARRRGRLEEAAGLLRRALAADPLDGEAWVALGELEAARGDREEAARAFRRALEIDPGDGAAAAGLERLGGR